MGVACRRSRRRVRRADRGRPRRARAARRATRLPGCRGAGPRAGRDADRAGGGRVMYQQLLGGHVSVTHALQGKRVAPTVSLVVFPGSHRILEVMAREGLLTDLLAAGANVSEPTSGSCAGIGHVPATGTKSLRAFNRNFPGRSGTGEDAVYLCS